MFCILYRDCIGIICWLGVESKVEAAEPSNSKHWLQGGPSFEGRHLYTLQQFRTFLEKALSKLKMEGADSSDSMLQLRVAEYVVVVQPIQSHFRPSQHRSVYSCSSYVSS